MLLHSSLYTRRSRSLPLLYRRWKNFYLAVPSHHIDEVKSLGAHWDSDREMYYCDESNAEVSFAKWRPIKISSGLSLEDKDEILDLGAIYDKVRQEYVCPHHSAYKFKRWLQEKQVFLEIPYEEKDDAKALGAFWDTTYKKWWCFDHDRALFSKWPEVTEPEVSNRTYLEVPYEEKDDAKALGARWDTVYKKWWCFNQDRALFSKWSEGAYLNVPVFSNRTYMEVPYEEKDEAKALGARWDPSYKKWWCFNQDRALFSKWSEAFANDTDPEREISSSVSDVNSSNAIDSSEYTASPLADIDPSDGFIVFDLETTGFPVKMGKNYHPYNQINYYDSSRIVQICVLLCRKDNLQRISLRDVIIKADGFEITNSDIHGITNERSQIEGVDFKEAVETTFRDIFDRADTIIAHNADFDVNILKSELFRYDFHDLVVKMNTSKVICTVKKTQALFGKYPKLVDLYEYATGVPRDKMINQHNAEFDVIYLFEAIKALREKKILDILAT